MSLLSKILPTQRAAHLDAIEEAVSRLLPPNLARPFATPEDLGELRNAIDERLESGSLQGSPAMAAVRAQRDACDCLMPVLVLRARIGQARQQIAQDRDGIERARAEASKEVKRAEAALATARRAAVQPEQRLRHIDDALARHRAKGDADLAAASSALDEALLTGADEADLAAAAGLQDLRRKVAEDLALLQLRRDAAAKVHDAQAVMVREAEARLAAAQVAQAAAAVQLAQLEADAAASEFVAGLLAVVRESLAASAAGEKAESDRMRALASLRVVAFDAGRAWYGPWNGAGALVVQPFDALVQLARLLDGPPLDVTPLTDAVTLPLAA